MNKKIQSILCVVSALLLSSTFASAALDGGERIIPVSLEELKASKESIRADRKAAVEAFLESNPEATREEVSAVVYGWNKENAELLAAHKELRERYKSTLDLPDFARGGSQPPVELKADIDAHRAESARLKSGRRTAVSDFVEANPEATKEEIRAVIAAYNETNADEIAANRELGESIRVLLKEHGPKARPVKRSDARERFQSKRDRLKNKADEYKEARKELRNLSPEERRAYFKENPESRNAAREALKDLMRKEREEDESDARGAE